MVNSSNCLSCSSILFLFFSHCLPLTFFLDKPPFLMHSPGQEPPHTTACYSNMVDAILYCYLNIHRHLILILFISSPTKLSMASYYSHFIICYKTCGKQVFSPHLLIDLLPYKVIRAYGTLRHQLTGLSGMRCR